MSTFCNTNTLYISYDGLLEPLGESQVVAYVERLASQSQITLISFEKRVDISNGKRMSTMGTRLRARGIEWIPLNYHKQPPVISTAYDVLSGIAVALVTGASRCQMVHARGYVAALIALTLKRLLRIKFLFDMRGFWADEKVDAGHWSKSSLIYRIAKAWERRFFESADGIVSLTETGVAAFASLGYHIRKEIPIAVIPTCTDLERFSPGGKDSALLSRFGLDGRVVIGCTGTMSNWYLRESMLACLSYLVGQIDRVTVFLVTREDHEQVRADAKRAGIAPHRLVITEAPFAAMPEYLRLMDAGLFFIKPCFSKKGSSATKLGEFMATGVPVVINDGVGDSGLIVRQHDVGVVLSGVGPENFHTAARESQRLLADPFIPRRCRETAERYFDLRNGVQKYQCLYAKLGEASRSRNGRTR